MFIAKSTIIVTFKLNSDKFSFMMATKHQGLSDPSSSSTLSSTYGGRRVNSHVSSSKTVRRKCASIVEQPLYSIVTV